MFVITGAGGRLGSLIIDRLLEDAPREAIAVSVRDPRALEALSARGVRVRAGDFTRPQTLDRAFEGADQVLIVSPAIRDPQEYATAARAAIDAAVRSGASRVLYTSHQCASPRSRFSPGRHHDDAEAHLSRAAAEHGASWAALRHGFYASTLEFLLAPVVAGGELRLPADGPWAWTAHEDLAAADVAVLRDPSFTGSTAPLSAPHHLDLAEVAGIASEILGRRIARVVLGDDEWRADAVANGMPEAAADFTLGMFRAAREGEFAPAESRLEEIIGRPSIDARTVIEGILGRNA